MLTISELEQLCLQPESAILDFKRSFYEFGNREDDKSTAAFVKDILAMTNTVRSQTGYIIFGIKQTPGQASAFIGVSSVTDDAILQDKIKSKLIPRPDFNFYSLAIKGVTIAILEVPVRKYASPVTCTVKMKGIEPGKVYHRRGSSNTEALGNEVIHIYEWLKSFPDIGDESQKDAELSQLLVQAANPNSVLSPTIAAIFNFARKHKLDELIEFCKRELNGLDNSEENTINPLLQYRVINTFVTHASVTINLSIYSISQLKDAFKKEKSFTEANVLLNQSLSGIENIINNFSSSDARKLATMNTSSKEFFPELSKEYMLTIYLFPDDLSHLYTRIRQETIRLLIKL